MVEDKDIEILCRNLLYLRKKRRLTQKEMAKLLGIGVGSLRRIERGELPPGVGCGMLFNAHSAFGIPPAVLLGKDLAGMPFSR